MSDYWNFLKLLSGEGDLFSVSNDIPGAATGWKSKNGICVGSSSGIWGVTCVGGVSRVCSSIGVDEPALFCVGGVSGIGGLDFDAFDDGWTMTVLEVFTSLMVLTEVTSSSLKIFLILNEELFIDFLNVHGERSVMKMKTMFIFVDVHDGPGHTREC